jgi:hypothetical protein
MKRKRTSLFLIALVSICLLISFPASVKADAYFTLKNTDNQTRIVMMLWMSHPFRNIDGPFPIAGAVLGPGKSFTLKSKYKPGAYLLEWRYKTAAEPDKVYFFEFGDEVERVLITPDRAVNVEEGDELFSGTIN